MTEQSEKFRPRYGKSFRCIGPACEDTCCHGWSIPVDKATYEQYQEFPEGDLRVLTAQYVSINTVNATDSLYAQISLTAAKNCPFLTDERLCGIQSQHGAEYLSATCSIYPRVLNQAEGELELSLYLSCPEAARMVLLNPDFAEIDSAEKPYFRTDQFSRLAGNGEGSIHKPYAYFDEVRECIVTLLRDRNRPLWQRVFLLGTLCQRLDEFKTAEQDQAVPQILADYRNIVSAGALRNEMESIPAQPAVQLDAILRLADMRIREGASGERFQGCFQDFVKGVGYAPNLTAAEYAVHYVEAEARYSAPFFAAHPFILENYLLNYVFRTLFPFGRAASAHHTPQSIFNEFILMSVQYAVIRGLLIGMAGHYREAFGTEHVIKLVQSFSKAVEHSPSYLKKAGEFIRERNLDNNQGLATLLKI